MMGDLEQAIFITLRYLESFLLFLLGASFAEHLILFVKLDR
jgi:hypothetical protein